MSEFFKSYKFKILLAILAVLIGMILYSASSEDASNIPRNLLEIITSPFQKASAYISDKTGDIFDKFISFDKIANENEELKNTVAELNSKLIELEKLKDENEQLKDIVEIKEIYPDFETTVAFVVSRDPSDRYSSFMIDRGTLHGVSVNDPVITVNGLVGIITKVGPISARVKTIFSPESNISAIEISSKELGVIKGDLKLSDYGFCRFSILSETTNLKKGDTIITAGASGIFPKGIPIGQIEEIKNEAHGITKYATIKPSESVEEVVSVQVVTSFTGKGSPLIDYMQ